MTLDRLNSRVCIGHRGRPSQGLKTLLDAFETSGLLIHNVGGAAGVDTHWTNALFGAQSLDQVPPDTDCGEHDAQVTDRGPVFDPCISPSGPVYARGHCRSLGRGPGLCVLSTRQERGIARPLWRL